MQTKSELDHLVGLTASEEVKSICQPLLDKLEIDYFTFHRIFNDATTIRLSTYPEWSKCYIEKNFFMIFIEDHYPCISSNYAYYIWDDYLKISQDEKMHLCIVRESFQNFSIHHGFTIMRRHLTYCESYNFAYRRDNKTYNSTHYLSHIEFLENFCSYFIKCAQQLIFKAMSNRFKTKYSSHDNSDSNFEPTLDLKLGSNFSFKTLTCNLASSLSRRELECLSYMAQGLSAKETAKLLNLSFRTVQLYHENIRRKTNTSKNIEVVNLFYRSYPAN